MMNKHKTAAQKCGYYLPHERTMKMEILKMPHECKTDDLKLGDYFIHYTSQATGAEELRREKCREEAQKRHDKEKSGDNLC